MTRDLELGGVLLGAAGLANLLDRSMSVTPPSGPVSGQSHTHEKGKMLRSTFAPMFALCGLLWGCAGAVEDDELLDEQSEAEDTEEAALAIATSIQIRGAKVTFESYGDHLYVTDTEADGHSAVGYVSGNPCWNPGGAGVTRNCNYNFGERETVSIYACIGEYGPGKILDCVGPKWVSARNH